jgi:hypothetical protein
MTKKELNVIRTFYIEPKKDDKSIYATGIYFELENGDVLQQLTCLDNCLVSFNKIGKGKK